MECLLAPLALCASLTSAPPLSLEPAWQLVSAEPETPPPSPRVRLTLSLANTTAAAAREATVAPCVDLAAFSVIVLGLSSVGEEYAIISEPVTCGSHSGHHAMHLLLDRKLRFGHEVGETVGVMPDSLQVPAGRLYGRHEPVSDVHHARAIAVATRAKEWIIVTARVLSSGPDKWALRQLLFVLALSLLGICMCAIGVLLCSRRPFRAHVLQ